MNYEELTNKELIDLYLACIGKTYYYFVNKAFKFQTGTVHYIKTKNMITDKMFLRLVPVLFAFKDKEFDRELYLQGIERAGVTLYSLSKIFGTKVYKWADGTQTPNQKHLAELEKTLNIEFDYAGCQDRNLWEAVKKRYLELGGDIRRLSDAQA